MPQQHLRLAVASVLTLICLGVATLSAQDSPASRARATDLGHVWSAIGQGDYRTANQLASELLKRYPADHGVVGAAVSSMAAGTGPTAALDIYEQWLRRSRHEDVFLLQPIASATLVEIGLSDDVGLAADALAKLAVDSPDVARATIQRRAAPEPAFDRVLAGMGDEAAKARLIEELAGQTSRERLAGLRDIAGLRGIPPAALSPLLTDPAPPVRAAAAEALGQMRDASAVSQLHPLLEDPDSYVQAMTAVALARLGDPDGRQAIGRMAGSDVGDTAAMAAQVLKEQGVDVSAIVERVLVDPNPLTRLSAVPLLSENERARGDALLAKGASDPNPVIRGRAAALLADHPPSDPAVLRRLLRDSSPEVRSGAAAALLRITSAR